MTKEGLENLPLTRHIEARLREVANMLANVRVWIGRDSKETIFIKIYKGQKDVESHDHTNPEWTRHREI